MTAIQGRSEHLIQSQLDPTKARRLPLFVASTFRDMDRERDLLNNVVVPQVNARLRQRGEWQTTIYPVDLRWGVQTDANDVAEVRDREILTTCVTEVRRCRPLFLGLVGDRYGWVVPDPDEGGYSDIRPAGWDQPLSVTAIELLTAADESLNDGVSPVVLKRTSTTTIPESQAPGAQDAALTDRLLSHLEEMDCIVIRYEAHWDSSHECLVSDDFVTVAVEVILHQVESVLASVGARHWFDVELDAQRASSELFRLPIVGRDSELATLVEETGVLPPSLRYGDDHQNAIGRLGGLRGARTVVVEGEEGSGVTTLLSAFAARGTDQPWARHWLGSRAPAVVHVGLTELSKRPEIVVLLLMAQLSPDKARELVGGKTPSDVSMQEVLPAWLDLLAAFDRGDPVTIVVDGVDHVRSDLGPAVMSWLPPLPNGEVKFFLGVEKYSFETQVLRSRPATRWISLEPLTQDAAKTLVLNRVTAAHKQLPPGLLDILSTGNRQPGWLALAADLMMTLLGESYRQLSSEIGQRDAQAALLGLLEAEARGLSQTMEDLRFEQVYRAFQMLPAEKVGAVLLLLAVCKSPLRETDLLAIGGPGKLNPMELSLIRSALGSALRPGRDWQVSDRYTSMALQEMLDDASEAAGSDVSLAIRRMLIGYLLSLPIDDPVREAELLPQLLATGHYSEFVQAITDPAFTGEESIGSATEAMMLSPDKVAVMEGLCDAAGPPEERLTLAGLLIVTYLRAMPPDGHARLIVRLRALLADCGSSVNRGGATAQVLSSLIDSSEVRTGHASFDPEASMAWIQGISAVPPEATLADAPAPEIEWPGSLRWMVSLERLALFGMAKTGVRAEGEDPEICDTDRRIARETIAEAQAAEIPEPSDRLRDLSVDFVGQALAFAADGEANPEALRTLVDGCRRLRNVMWDSESLRLWSQAVRLRTTVIAAQLPESFETEPDASLFLDLSTDFAELIWHLDMERWIYDDDLLISMERSLARIQYASWLELFDQHTTSASYGVPAVSDPLALSTLGPEVLVWLGGNFIALWILHPDTGLAEEATPADPSGWVEHVLSLLDNDTLGMFTDPEEIEAAASLVIGAAGAVAERLERFDLLMQVVALVDRRRRHPLWSPVIEGLLEGLREEAVNLESELLPPEDEPASEWLAAVDDLEPDEVERWMGVLVSLAAFRKALDPESCEEATRAALGLTEALGSRLLRNQAGLRASLDSVRDLSRSDDEHVIRMVRTVALLDSDSIS